MTLEDFRRLQAGTDRWFGELLRSQKDQMKCSRGCALCCHGLFDISIPDALILAEGIAGLSAAELDAARKRACLLQREIGRLAPDLEPPFLLSEVWEERIDRIVSSMSGARCPLLGDNDTCIVYGHRPMACRMEGAPMVDETDGLFGDWCELNFVDGVPAEALPLLRRDYSAMQSLEERAARSTVLPVAGEPSPLATVFIPSVLAAFDEFWREWLR